MFDEYFIGTELISHMILKIDEDEYLIDNLSSGLKKPSARIGDDEPTASSLVDGGKENDDLDKLLAELGEALVLENLLYPFSKERKLNLSLSRVHF
ncbi:hypothetical protein F2Q68_00034894 [Brassica cretica]|uniref:Uncharacterized protein n=1 Tax=Brassica cretica TaxID=69181 RepID=A0A8S9H8F3_BRACR|nr:hypothetical protein F2Q68_00034894 [Brassica cretica]